VELVVKRLLLIQLALCLVTAAAVLMLTDLGFPGALAALYGGTAAIIGTAFGAWRVRAATAATSAVSAVELFRGLILRMVVIIALLAAGLGWLKLHPAALISGFVVTYLGFLFIKVPRAEPTKRP